MEPLEILTAFVAVGWIGFAVGKRSRGQSDLPAALRRLLPRDKRSLAASLAVGSLALALLFSVLSDTSRFAPFIFFCFLSYWLLLPYWVYLDAKRRSERAWAWALMTLMTNVMGLFSYLITRPEKTQACPRCGCKLREEFVICPYCGPDAGRSCESCGSMLESDWNFCPYCRASIHAFNSREEEGPTAPYLPPEKGAPGEFPGGFAAR